MPQISKIRIANFQYNDGKRLIADELFDFADGQEDPSDVLINLANGGGKSVLVQLTMQPIVPKAKVANRRIESFFTKPTDHCYVVIEWALDDSKMKLMTGIAMAASDSSTDADTDRGFQVKYYTFLSAYQDYRGNCNIISLPLSKKEDGKFIPAPFDEVRNLVKKSGGQLERYSSDDGSKWKDRLAEFGIMQNEWRMIEELNSNEDGLSKYFSTLKTSDAVIDKLIIPRIEERESGVVSHDDSSLETMMIAYARQYLKQRDDIKEREILQGFRDLLNTTKDEANELSADNEALEKCVELLFAYAESLRNEIKRQEDKKESLWAELASIEENIRRVEWEKASAKYYETKDVFERETARLQTAEADKTEAKEALESAKKKLALCECAHYYSQLKNLESQLEAVAEEIANRERHSESADRLASLKYSSSLAIHAELNRIAPDLEALPKTGEALEATIASIDEEAKMLGEALEMAKTEVIQAETTLNMQKVRNDETVEKLDAGAFRMLDGKYRDEDLRARETEHCNKERALAEAIEETRRECEQLEERKDAIPREQATAEKEMGEINLDLRAETARMEAFRSDEEQLKSIFMKHGLDESLRFTDYAETYLRNEIELLEASLMRGKRQSETIEEAIASVGKGALHVPKKVTEYLDEAGFPYVTVEHYLLSQQEKGNLTAEKIRSFLEHYPFSAYGVIMNYSDAEELRGEADGEWLPSPVPVFDSKDMDEMLAGLRDEFPAVAVYSKEYFRNREAFVEGLRDGLGKQEAQNRLLEEKKANLAGDMDVVKAFSLAYGPKWEEEVLAKIKKSEEALAEKNREVLALSAELIEVKGRVLQKREEEKELIGERQGTCRVLAEFKKLFLELEEEDSLRDDVERACRKQKELDGRRGEIALRRAGEEERLKGTLAQLKELRVLEEELRKALQKVAGTTGEDATGAATSVPVIVGTWTALLAQYETLLSSQSADMERLQEDKNRLVEGIGEKNREIEKRNCAFEEYAELRYSVESEKEAESGRLDAEKAYQVVEDAYMKAFESRAKANVLHDNSVEMLKEFGGAPLPLGEVGKAYGERIADLKKQTTGIKKEAKGVEENLAKLQKAQGKTETATDRYPRPEWREGAVPVVALSDDFVGQLDNLCGKIRAGENVVAENEQKVRDSLKKMASDYGIESADVNVAVACMQNLLSNTGLRGDRYKTLCKHLETNIHTAELRIGQIDTDMKEFDKAKDDLIHQCVIQGRLMHEGLMRISRNSKVKVQDKRKQILKFDIPEEIDPNVARIALTAEVEKGVVEIVAKMAEDAYSEAEVRKIAEKTVGSKRLLRKYIGIENIVLKAYKIDRNPENSGYRTWDRTQVNSSGAEKFVVYFAIILALMAYARDEYHGFDEKKNRSVLILDNPFGPISSKHVLEPMFEIARNYKVQMICLSDISKSDIVSCFNLVIRAVVKQFSFNKEYLTHEGNEAIEHGFYRSEQMRLFDGE